MKFFVRPVARQDIIEQFRYYLIEKGAETTAYRYLDAVQQAIEEVCRHPDMGTPKRLKHTSLQGLRTFPVKGFPSMRIYYLHGKSTVRIVRILHGKRDIDPMLEDDGGPF